MTQHPLLAPPNAAPLRLTAAERALTALALALVAAFGAVSYALASRPDPTVIEACPQPKPVRGRD